LLAAVGVSDRPNANPEWAGGPVSGVIVNEQDTRSLFARMFGHDQVLRPMLVVDQPVAGFRQAARPSPDQIPNNHLLYAIQWFIFAGAAAVIYVLALRRRTAGE
jgi:cytochrome oxidase assembly protein ShyY1